MLDKYHWQIVDAHNIEIIPSEREQAWKELIITALLNTPRSFRSNLRAGSLRHFDFNQPIYYNIKLQKLAITNDDLIRAMTPPHASYINSNLLRPMHVLMLSFVLILAFVAWEGIKPSD